MEQTLLFAFLVLFPFGQIIRLSFNFLGFNIPLQPLDVIAGLSAVYVILKKLKKPEVFKYFDNFLVICLFTFIFSVFVFKTHAVVYGLFYLIRLAAYFYFFILVKHFADRKKANAKLLVSSLLAVSVVSAIFGWIQFFKIPDIKPFFVYGWDEHLFRLVGTFLDPTFLGLIIVFGLFIALYKNKYFTVTFLLVSLAFTYSRAAYLAFIAGLIFIGLYQKKLRKVIGLTAVLVLLIVLLPTKYNHSIEFFRSFSALARIENYKQTIKVFKTSPIFGVGFNNMCLARQTYIGPESFASHACSGSDSSLLMLLATTGVAGFFSFCLLAIGIWKKSTLFMKSLLIALFAHSLFSNSLFYPWIMGYVLILLAVSGRESQG